MTQWPSTKARRVYAVLLSVGWQLERQTESHRTLSRNGYPDFVFAFHDGPDRSVRERRSSPCVPHAMKPKSSGVAEMRPGYDFSNGVRGKYHKRLAKEGSKRKVVGRRSAPKKMMRAAWASASWPAAQRSR